MKKTLLFSLIAVMVVVLAVGVFSNTASASTTEFAGGSGTEADPYLIATKEHLNNVHKYQSANFKMIADIIFSEEDFAKGGDFYNSGSGWEPIGSRSKPFWGTFDGNEHKICNLYINKEGKISSDLYAGLFGYWIGTIKNLGVVDSNINITVYPPDTTKTIYVGAIAGYVRGSIENCYNTGNISSSISKSSSSWYYSLSYSGGIVGYAYQSTITNCYNTGNIESSSDSSAYYDVFAGGVIGLIDSSTIINCNNIGNISTNSTGDSYAGGILGFAQGEFAINNCYNTGLISVISNESDYVGGIVGNIKAGDIGKIENCYNTGNLERAPSFNSYIYGHIGGIAGYIHSGVSIVNCYNIGDFSAKFPKYCYLGSIVGAKYGTSTTNNCYYLNTSSKGMGTGTIDDCLSCNLEEMQNKETFVGFDFENVWEFKEKNLYLYPTLINNPYFEGESTEEDVTESNPRTEAIKDAISGTTLTTDVVGGETVIIVPTSENNFAMTESELASILNDASITITSNNGIIGTGCKVNIGEYEVDLVVKGDIDGDGVATVFDALMVKKALANNGFENEALREFAADVDGATGTTEADVDAILSYIVGKGFINNSESIELAACYSGNSISDTSLSVITLTYLNENKYDVAIRSYTSQFTGEAREPIVVNGITYSYLGGGGTPDVEYTINNDNTITFTIPDFSTATYELQQNNLHRISYDGNDFFPEVFEVA